MTGERKIKENSFFSRNSINGYFNQCQSMSASTTDCHRCQNKHPTCMLQSCGGWSLRLSHQHCCFFLILWLQIDKNNLRDKSIYFGSLVSRGPVLCDKSGWAHHICCQEAHWHTRYGLITLSEALASSTKLV